MYHPDADAILRLSNRKPAEDDEVDEIILILDVQSDGKKHPAAVFVVTQNMSWVTTAKGDRNVGIPEL